MSHFTKEIISRRHAVPGLGREPEVEVGGACGHSPPGRAHEKTLLDQIGLQYILYGAPLLSDGRRQIIDPDRPAVEFFDDRQQQAPIHAVETVGVHLQHRKRGVSDRGGDMAVTLDLGIVAHPAQQTIGDARCAPGTPCDLGVSVALALKDALRDAGVRVAMVGSQCNDYVGYVHLPEDYQRLPEPGFRYLALYENAMSLSGWQLGQQFVDELRQQLGTAGGS